MDDVSLLLARINALAERVAALERNDQPIGTVSAIAAKTTPVIADSMFLIDSAASSAIKTVTLSNLFANTNTTSSYTAQLKFGGASVGMTGTFNGLYAKLGRMVAYACTIILTAKGSSVGDATVDLPFTNNGSATGYYIADHRNMNASYVQVGLVPSFGNAFAGVRGATAATTTLSNLSNTAFTDTSVLVTGGIYFTP